mmetsp:Transcript_78261/g.153131  ORF Transcript_78261/g.153131 Transcript_78261/m.153131 type:complete len:255 (+) Transcript_78261:1394-2158(+)
MNPCPPVTTTWGPLKSRFCGGSYSSSSSSSSSSSPSSSYSSSSTSSVPADSSKASSSAAAPPNEGLVFFRSPQPLTGKSNIPVRLGVLDMLDMLEELELLRMYPLATPGFAGPSAEGGSSTPMLLLLVRKPQRRPDLSAPTAASDEDTEASSEALRGSSVGASPPCDFEALRWGGREDGLPDTSEDSSFVSFLEPRLRMFTASDGVRSRISEAASSLAAFPGAGMERGKTDDRYSLLGYITVLYLSAAVASHRI